MANSIISNNFVPTNYSSDSSGNVTIPMTLQAYNLIVASNAVFIAMTTNDYQYYAVTKIGGADSPSLTGSGSSFVGTGFRANTSVYVFAFPI